MSCCCPPCGVSAFSLVALSCVSELTRCIIIANQNKVKPL
nr:MAG TPA: hypothetical protein [Caudoviricetes sp.]